MLKRIRKSIAVLMGRDQTSLALEAMDRIMRMRATYDAERTSDEYSNYWANADRFDADSAHSKGVRHTLISRSRYETGNNPYAAGIASTYSTDLVGKGPALRMQTGSQGFNQMVELSWFLWCKSINFRRKFWCMAHAKYQDGEAFAVIRRNPNVNHPIKLDLQLYEAEQVQTPMPSLEAGYIDGMKFDKFGNALWYDVLSDHPGAINQMTLNLTAERVPADIMLHWFKMKRPGQHRGVPECASSLNTGAAARRWREATLSAAERAALLTLMVKTQMTPDEAQAVAPFSTMDLEKGLLNFLPGGWDPMQLEGKFPTANHEQFHRNLVSEQARPISMPRNKALCDSSDSNYASGQLDQHTYYGQLDVEREDGNDLCLDPLFDVWFDLAVMKFRWLGGNPAAIGPAARIHVWDWPQHRVADIEAQANANQVKLKSGQTFLHNIASESGTDFEDELEKSAATFGVSVEQLRSRILDVLYPPVVQGGAPGSPTSTDQAVADTALAAVLRRLEIRRDSLAVKTNGHTNGVHDEN